MARGVAIGIALLACAAASSAAGPCGAWSEGSVLGVLDPALVPEASGLASSRERPVLYHVNDSGRGPFLYASGLDGGGLQRLRLDGVAQVVDPEALAVGPILGEPTLLVADIGDNLRRRPSVELFAIRERDLAADRAPIFARLAVRYPGEPHNAEAIAIGPDGSVYLFTKSWYADSFSPAPSRIYRLAPSSWNQPANATVDLEFLGQLDLPALATREHAPLSDVVTDASMSQDGSRFLILTYGYAWEFALDLAAGVPSTDALQRGRDYQLIRLPPAVGKETIAYLPGDRSFLYGKEFQPDRKPSTLTRLTCQD